MQRRIPQPPHVLFPSLTQSPEQRRGGRLRFSIRIDVTQRPTETDIQADELPGIAGLRMRSNAPLGTLPHRSGNLDAAGVRIVNPCTHDSSPSNFRVQTEEPTAEEISQLCPCC